ncbi:MAG: hypothetical protein NTV24_04145 [Candidatus Woesebacteria bacterium]|nr:hypothetical protein [Candidatus Woesebacteria bacterium]
MLETPHALLGAVIAVKLGNPALSIPIAFASHFILEKVPHWNPHLTKETIKYGQPTKQSTTIVIIDSSLALILGSAIAFSQAPNTAMVIGTLLSSFAAVLPDLIEAPYFFLKVRNNKYIKRWIKFQKGIQVDAPPFWGLLTQVLTIAAIFLWLR